MRKPIPVQVRVEAPQRTPFEERLRELRRPLQALDQTDVVRRFQLPVDATLLKTTLSLCPDCLAHVHAAVYVEHGRVLIAKACATHGLSRALLENDARYYRLSNKDQWGRTYTELGVVQTPDFAEGGCCGPGATCATVPTADWTHDSSDQRSNKTCTVLVEVTDACNLACRVCYADSRGDRVLSLEEFRKHRGSARPEGLARFGAAHRRRAHHPPEVLGHAGLPARRAADIEGLHRNQRHRAREGRCRGADATVPRQGARAAAV